MMLALTILFLRASFVYFFQGYKGELLSKFTTSEVSDLLGRIGGINHQQLPKYKQAVIENNINGMVLYQCDLNDLGKCMEMKFGDWQLFRTAVQALKDTEDNPPTEKGEEEVDILPAITKQRSVSNIESNTRSIHFSSSDIVSKAQSQDSVEINRSRGTFRRQSSVDTQKGVDSNPAFDVIEEEAENNDEAELPSSRSTGNMKRNDSVVAQMMYESGLLREVMHNFTENVSEEDEADGEDSAAEIIPNGDLIDIIKSDSQKEHIEAVHFSISMDQTTSHHYDDENKSASPEVQGSDREPLLTHTKSVKKAATLGGPVPILKLPAFKSPKSEQKPLRGNARSEPDLLNPQKQETTLYQEDQPLLPVTKSVSTTSSGFTEASIHPQVSVTSNESIDCISLVDETRSSQDRKKRYSLEDSIQMYTFQRAGGSGRAGSEDDAGSVSSGLDVKLITKKDGKKDRKSPVDFV